jgi:deferrochelatase/peroxidase EfeB
MAVPTGGENRLPKDADAAMSASVSGIAPDDVQGIIVRGYGSTLPRKRHMIFTINDPAGAREFLQALLPSSGNKVCVSDAQLVDKNDAGFYRLNVALTYAGLQQILSPTDCTTLGGSTCFGPFAAGADNPTTALNVGDINASAPANWWKNGGSQLPGNRPPAQADLHVVISCYAQTTEQRDELEASLLGLIPDSTTPAALTLAYKLDSDPLDNRDVSIHFGYGDGFSQPRIGGWGDDDPKDDRPVVDASHFVITAPAGADYTANPFLANGSFAAFRVLFQDSAAFEAFLDNAGENRELLAAKMCGRWRDGTPLELSPDNPDSSVHGIELTNFQYLSPSPHQAGDPPRLSTTPDAFGLKCPMASHIRRTNPRDDTNVRGNPDMASFNRVMRRANAYGPKYVRASGVADETRGLVGYFIGANLAAQFEFLFQQWVYQPPPDANDTSPNAGGVDPLFGPNDPNAFVSPNFYYNTLQPGGATAYVDVTGAVVPPNGDPQGPPMTQFVRTDGGLYVFFPSITALGLLSQGKIA